jgi:hypothetical protein
MAANMAAEPSYDHKCGNMQVIVLIFGSRSEFSGVRNPMDIPPSPSGGQKQDGGQYGG